MEKIWLNIIEFIRESKDSLKNPSVIRRSTTAPVTLGFFISLVDNPTKNHCPSLSIGSEGLFILNRFSPLLGLMEIPL